MPGRSPAVQSLCTDLTCPVCLEYYSDPVTLACGHSFCCSCISRCWQIPCGSFSCPVCRQHFARRTLERNWQLAEAVQHLHAQQAQPSKGSGCAKRQQNLKLFCQNDESVLCAVCDRSQDHRSHSLIPVEKAAQEYKTQWTQNFRKQRAMLGANFPQKLLSSKNWSKTCRKPAAKFLKNVKSTIMRCETAKLPLPNVTLIPDRSNTLVQCPHQDSQLFSSRILLKEISQHFKADVTLDGKTANPYLVVYENGRRVKRCDTKQDVPDNPERFDSDPCVLTCEGFTSGRHYWEVEVEDGRHWALGVTKASVRRKGGVRATPEEGIWAIGLFWNQYRALTSAVNHLSLSQGLQKAGLFLDFDLGEISFYNAETMEHIYTFYHRFTEKIFPLVWVWSTEARIKLSP
uniref:Zinc finger protein RFP-like n=1 Tax=Geotrypetes seraphini TaxID=260995 RepID=A0A6P8NRS6_GEOSA|nr:zinc finger protein RFP-like [Geotrypetes seraphini]